MAHKVLVITGGLISVTSPSLPKTLSMQVSALRAAQHAWVDAQLKLLAAERVLAVKRSLPSLGIQPYADTVRRLFDSPHLPEPPELTEVLLCTLLEEEGMAFEVSTYAELHSNAELRERLLEECDCVFASTTLLRDLSELAPFIALFDRPNNKIVVGGALIGILHAQWKGMEGVDLLAVGYGEWLVGPLVQWIRSGFTELEAPERGRVENRNGTPILYSGLTEGLSLDGLVKPDWALAERVHGQPFPLVTYESVRGCPYRCAFCNYPFLFDDTRFRTLSAKRIADDWLAHARRGVTRIRCLDSLFTMPRKRIRALCEMLIAAGSPVEWIAYARSDDLTDLNLARLMRTAGCVQLQIGIESGSQQQLDNMNKRCTVEHNARALQNCREVGITTLTTLIVGFPGETEATLDETEAFMRANPPDFYFLAPFSTKYVSLPILQPKQRTRFGLQTHYAGRSAFPHWKHDSMNVLQAVGHLARLNHIFMEEGLALEATAFFEVIDRYQLADRADLLAFQAATLDPGGLLGAIFGGLGRFARYRAREDQAQLFERPRNEGLGVTVQPEL